MSSPIQPSGTSTPSSGRGSASAENSWPATRSIGSRSLSPPAASTLRAGSRPSSSHSESPTSWPCALKNGKHIAPPIEDPVGGLEEGLEHADLVRHLGAPDDRHERALGRGEDALERRDLALQQAAGSARQQVRHGLGGGVRAVGGAERVVDVDVGQRGVALRQLGVVLRLARLEADVLEHHDVPVGHVVEGGRQHDLLPQQLGEPVGRGPERVLLLAPLRPAEVRGEQQARALLAQLLQRGQRRADPRVVGDGPVLVQGDVEVHPDEDALALDVEVVKRAHAPAPSGPAPRSGWSSPTRCRTR